MQADSVAEVADQLYALTPAEFTAARDEQARAARAAGQRDAAAAIKKLARPTASAWLVNQLARSAPDQMARLVEVGEALQEAQRTLAGDRLRELAGGRRQVINDLLLVATEFAERAGPPASAAVLREVRTTLEAALADPEARNAVRSGQLTKALAYAGIGEVDLTAALALPGRPRALAGRSRGRAAATPAAARPESAAEEAGSSAGRAASPATRQAKAQQALQEAQATADQAQAALAEAERQVVSLAEQRQFLRRRLDHLERELAHAKAEDAQLAREAKLADRSRDSAAREADAAAKRLTQAQRRASDNSGSG